MTMRIAVSLIFIVLAVGCLAQSVSKLKPGTSTYKAVTLAARKEFQKSAAYPIKTPGGYVKRFGNWAYIHDRLEFVNPKHIGDGEGIALLKFSKGKWKVIEAEVGSGGMEDLTDDWTRKYKLPKTFLND